jgi:hypothetical protein
MILEQLIQNTTLAEAIRAFLALNVVVLLFSSLALLLSFLMMVASAILIVFGLVKIQQMQTERIIVNGNITNSGQMIVGSNVTQESVSIANKTQSPANDNQQPWWHLSGKGMKAAAAAVLAVIGMAVTYFLTLGG